MIRSELHHARRNPSVVLSALGHAKERSNMLLYFFAIFVGGAAVANGATGNHSTPIGMTEIIVGGAVIITAVIAWLREE